MRLMRPLIEQHADYTSIDVHIYRAPWSRRYRTMYVRGSVAYEVQVGSLVIQLFYQKPDRQLCGHGRFHVWQDHYTNYPRYRRSALWGVS